jgi:uncharacterized protein GlcG (DUF336 family)
MLAKLRAEADPTLMAELEASPAWQPSAGAPLGAKFFGGCVPVFVGGDIVGYVGTSGAADVVDHEATAEGCRRYLQGPKL